MLGRISIHTDISEERKLQIEVEDLAQFCEVCPFPVVRCDGQGIVLYSNLAFRQLLDQVRLSPEEATHLLPKGLVHQISEVFKTSGSVDFKGDDVVAFSN